MDEIGKIKTESVASVKDGHDAQKGMYMTFLSGNECYGLKIQYVNEIIGLSLIHI